MARRSSASSTAPEQFKITHEVTGYVKLAWVTPSGTDSTVAWGADKTLSEISTNGTVTSYTCQEASCGGPGYWSGQLHGASLGPLTPGTTYYYSVKSDPVGVVNSFVAPAAAALVEGFTFAVVGDLGATSNTVSTINHIAASGAPFLVHPGDLSYANCDQPLWDSYGRLMDPLAKTIPWMTLTGNHEEEETTSGYKCGKSMNTSFAAYDFRYGQYLPFEESGSTSPHYYSFEVAGAHWIMLGSYTDYSVGSPQLEWLAADLASIDRSRTPWVFASLHSPWYNSNKAHYNETEEYYFRVNAEGMLREANVNAMFAGHVHAYERSFPTFNNQPDACGLTYITIGDGGNAEGLAATWYSPQPTWSAFREASYGHGELVINSASEATWTWHRNQDDEDVISDTVVLTNGCL